MARRILYGRDLNVFGGLGISVTDTSSMVTSFLRQQFVSNIQY